jgi:hypothetical protein
MVKCLIIMFRRGIVKKENYMNSCSCKASMCTVPAIQRVEKLRKSKSGAIVTVSADGRGWEDLKGHKIEIFFGFNLEICNISLLVMPKY